MEEIIHSRHQPPRHTVECIVVPKLRVKILNVLQPGLGVTCHTIVFCLMFKIFSLQKVSLKVGEIFPFEALVCLEEMLEKKKKETGIITFWLPPIFSPPGV